MTNNPKDLNRYTSRERTNHWIVAICFILVALSGLTFFHPFFWPFSELFGGGVWTRILHPFIGILIAICFALLFMQFHRLNRMTPVDWDWLKHVDELVKGNEDKMPPQEKYNAGQKMLFWSTTACIILMLLSGIIMWRAYFTFPLIMVRLASVVHAAVGVIFIALIFIHIYAAIWTRGTLHAMLYGTVSRAWAKQHHEIWYRQMIGD